MEKQQGTSTNIRLCMRETIMCDHLFLGSNAFTRFEHNLRLALLFQAVKKVNKNSIKDFSRKTDNEKLLLMTTKIPTLSSTLAVIAINNNKYLARISISNVKHDYYSIALIEVITDSAIFN